MDRVEVSDFAFPGQVFGTIRENTGSAGMVYRSADPKNFIAVSNLGEVAGPDESSFQMDVLA